MRRRTVPTTLLCLALIAVTPSAAMPEPPQEPGSEAAPAGEKAPPAEARAAGDAGSEDPGPAARIILAGNDWPDYPEDVATLDLAQATPEQVAAADPQYQRVSLVDIEEVPWLPKGVKVYQTVSIGVEMPVSLNFVVDGGMRAWCFNPEIPYCNRDFSLFNHWFKRAGVSIESVEEAGNLARFLVEMGLSTVHHPRDFLFFRLSQKLGVQNFQYLDSIEAIYEPYKAPYRSEQEAEEYATMTERYGDRVKRVVLEETEDGWRLHGFTYKMMKAAGDLREWDIRIHPDGTADVQVETLERGIGEITWSWAQ